MFDENHRTGGDRRPILLESASNQQGIAAALRRAFETVDSDRDDEFEALLRRI
ncbi:hypothetical protein H9L12_08820 [Sphingomonas rhizophila]|uniref:Uncharacterized protein n=1 Tax=Sphingomonas rhizophila TaxID=2071607 RepID=A0A7G9S9A2_9SPHN|nr:hypothetical protein [Sphingomonas rhizophila]QNN64427.1 hypothetical protein H9L12_08820 [Sphingomonas rhizophila]